MVAGMPIKYTRMYSTAPSMTSSGVFISVSMGRASTMPSTTRITPPTRPVSSEVCTVCCTPS